MIKGIEEFGFAIEASSSVNIENYCNSSEEEGEKEESKLESSDEELEDCI